MCGEGFMVMSEPRYSQMGRPIDSLQIVGTMIFAVCRDGTAWFAPAEGLRKFSQNCWVEIPAIPEASDEEVQF
jgi:hypothetical protein